MPLRYIRATKLTILTEVVLKKKNKAIAVLLLIFLPVLAYANGGGPLLLFISGSAFIYGQIWILFIETLMLRKVSGLNTKTTFKQVFYANLASTIIIGLGFPFILAIITGFAIQLPQPYGSYASALGTWVYDGDPHTKYIGHISLVWLFITFLLTVIYEKLFYKWYWRKVNFSPSFSINKFIWQAHVASYSGLLIIILLMWHDIFNL